MLLAGVFLFIGAHIPAALYASKLTGWTTPPGRYGTSIADTGGQASVTIAIILGLAGLLLLIWGSVIEDKVFNRQ